MDKCVRGETYRLACRGLEKSCGVTHAEDENKVEQPTDDIREDRSRQNGHRHDTAWILRFFCNAGNVISA